MEGVLQPRTVLPQPPVTEPAGETNRKARKGKQRAAPATSSSSSSSTAAVVAPQSAGRERSVTTSVLVKPTGLDGIVQPPDGAASQPCLVRVNSSDSLATASSSSAAASSSSSAATGAESRRGQLKRTTTRNNLKLEDPKVVNACQGTLPSDQLQKVYWTLIDMACKDEALLKCTLERSYATVLEQKRTQLRESTKRSGFAKMFAKQDVLPSLGFDKARLSFGLGNNDECPLQATLKDVVRLTCNGGKARFSWKRPKIHKSHCITIDPLEGVLKKGQSLDVAFTLTVNTTFILEEVVVLDIDDFGHLFFVINLVSEKSVFGVNTVELPATEDLGCQVPTVLQTLRHYLTKSDGMRSEGIFRLAPDEAETLAVKASLNKGESLDFCQDVNAIANLIKVWFRELPLPLLNVLPPDAFNAADEQTSLELLERLPEPNKSLFRWLLLLMADTARLEPVNKMGPRNLAIVIAPNLFDAADMPPLESLSLSQNVVNFVKLLLEHELRSAAPSSSSSS